MNPWLDAALRVLLHSTIAFSLVWLLVRLIPGLNANVRTWLWRLATLKCFWVVAISVPVALLPATSEIIADFPASPVTVTSSANLPVGTVAVPDSQPGLDPLVYLWLAGVAVGALRLSHAALRCRALRRTFSVFEDSEAHDLATQMGLRNRPFVAVSERVKSPMLVGIWRPVVVLPASLDGDQKRMAMAHEISHLRRRDSFWSLILHLATTIFWFAPPVFWAKQAAQLACEEACDADVLRLTGVAAESYSAMLLHYARPHRSPAFVLGLSSRKSLEIRIKSMMKPRRNPRRSAYAPLVILLAITLTPWTVVAQQPELSSVVETGHRGPLVEEFQSDIGHVLLERSNIRKELHLTNDQIAQLDQYTQEFQRKFKLFSAEIARQKRENVSDVERVKYNTRERSRLYTDLRRGDFNTLTPLQRDRLLQITLQVTQEMALGNRSIGNAIRLPETKREAFAALIADHYRRNETYRSRLFRNIYPVAKLNLSKLSPEERKAYDDAKRRLATVSGEERKSLIKHYYQLIGKAATPSSSVDPTSKPVQLKARETWVKWETAAIKDRDKTMAKIRSMLTPEERARWEEAKGKPFPVKEFRQM